MTKRVDIRLDTMHLGYIEDLKEHFKNAINVELTTTAIIKIAITALYDSKIEEREEEKDES